MLQLTEDRKTVRGFNFANQRLQKFPGIAAEFLDYANRRDPLRLLRNVAGRRLRAANS